MHISSARLASFCHFGFISDPLIVSKFHNETHDPKGQENKIYTIVKGRKKFCRCHTVPVTSCSEVKYVLKRVFGICVNRRLRSDCASPHKRYKSAYAPIEDSDQTAHSHIKGSSRQMRQWKTQIRLRIQAKSNKTAYAPIKLSDQTAHPSSKSYKLAYAPIEDSDQTAHPCTKVTSWHMRQLKTLIRLRIRAQKLQVGICAHRRLRSDCASAHKTVQVGICANRSLRSDCASAQQKL